MDHNCSVMGFLGMDKYEYIMYLSRVLYHLGKKVLMVDYSESGALASCIHYPKGIENEIIEYRGVMFLDRRGTKDTDCIVELENENSSSQFDYILVDYGYYVDLNELNLCHHLVYVTDQQEHNIRRLLKLNQIKDKRNSLIIKNVINRSITPKYIFSEMKFEPATIQTYVVYQDEQDTNCSLNCQYDRVFRFIKLSSQSKNVIKGLVVELFPEITKRELKEAYKKAERGV